MDEQGKTPGIESGTSRSYEQIDLIRRIIREDSPDREKTRLFVKPRRLSLSTIEEKPADVVILSEEMIEILLAHEKDLAEYGLSELIRIAEKIHIDPLTRENLRHIEKHRPDACFHRTDIEFAQILDPEVWGTDAQTEAFDFFLRRPDALKGLVEKPPRRICWEEITYNLLYPLPTEVKQELSYIDQYDLADKLKEVFAQIDSSNSRQRQMMARDIHNIAGIYEPSIIEFLFKHHRLITIQALREICQIPRSTSIDEETRIAIIAGSIRDTDMAELLSSMGILGPTAVLKTYRGYKSCDLSEPRLMKELQEDKAATLQLIFPTGETVLLATKFEEVTLCACVESTHPLFEQGILYVPIDRIKEHIQSKKGSHQVIELPQNKIEIDWVFAQNRRMHLEKLHQDKLRQLTADFIDRANARHFPISE